MADITGQQRRGLAWRGPDWHFLPSEGQKVLGSPLFPGRRGPKHSLAGTFPGAGAVAAGNPLYRQCVLLGSGGGVEC